MQMPVARLLHRAIAPIITSGLRQHCREFLSPVSKISSKPNVNVHLLVTHELYASSVQRRAMSNEKKLLIKEVEGDLFSAPITHSLAHCVGADLAMGVGIAVKFKQLYGQIDKLCAQGTKSGGVSVLKDRDRFIYYLVTKKRSYDKPTYESLRSSLTAMREHIRANCVTKLAMPRIGCGIDGLEWDKVSAELKDVFGAEQLEIVVYNFVPK